MKFFVKNKIMSLGGNSRVYDEADKDIYVVKGKMLSLTNKKKNFWYEWQTALYCQKQTI